MKKSASRKNKERRRKKAKRDILSRNRNVRGEVYKIIKPLTKAERKVMNGWGQNKKVLASYRSITQSKISVEVLDRELKFINVKDQLR